MVAEDFQGQWIGHGVASIIFNSLQDEGRFVVGQEAMLFCLVREIDNDEPG